MKKPQEAKIIKFKEDIEDMSKKNIPYKTYLDEKEMPKAWLNMKAFMPEQHDPFINPGTGKPCTAADLEPVFCTECVKQELNCTDKEIEIPDGIQKFYKSFRPSPLVRAYYLEEKLQTPAHIYYKFEGNNTSGSHKLNSAAAQAYYAKEQGLTSITTETGAGQWGTALAMAAAFYGLDLKVYMVKASYDQKPYRKEVIRTYGADIISSPSDTTEAGRKIRAEFPDTVGSLGCAISEAVEKAVTTPNCKYVLGSVLDHVLLHQSVIGLESKAVLDRYDEQPDIIIGCVGGGSNFGGLMAPYMADKLKGKNNIDFLGVEPASCPSFTRGKYCYDFCDSAKITPLAKMYTLGCEFMPSPDHAGGLRYHGMSPILSKLYHDGYMRVEAVKQTDVFAAAVEFARCEGILPAPESSHAIKAAMDEAIKCRETGEQKTILFGLTGTGYFDLAAYKQFNEGTLSSTIPTDADLERGFASIPKLD